MKYKDYYTALGIERDATADQVKSAYRRLARKFHPDVSKEAGAEDRFKEIAEAYQTLKDPEKRAAYDELGRQRPGQDFQPPPDWAQRFSEGATVTDDIDLADLFASFGGGRAGRGPPRKRVRFPGQDYEVNVQVTLEQAVAGAVINLDLSVSEPDEQGFPRTSPRSYEVQIPPGTAEGRRLRLAGKGGPGFNGGRNGDLYLTITYRPHPVYRAQEGDLYFDLALAPWEAVLGANVKVPTLAGAVDLRIAPDTPAGRKLRLSGRGMPRRDKGRGDLYAMVRIVVPSAAGEEERALYRQLAEASRFDPRAGG